MITSTIRKYCLEKNNKKLILTFFNIREFTNCAFCSCFPRKPQLSKQKITKTKRRIISNKMAEETHFVCLCPLCSCVHAPLCTCALMSKQLCPASFFLRPNVVDRLNQCIIQLLECSPRSL